MTNKITLKAQDGSTIEFYDEIKAQGGVKDVYFSTDKGAPDKPCGGLCRC